MMLQVKNLCVSYGAIKALKGISFDVENGEIISLISPLSGDEIIGGQFHPLSLQEIRHVLIKGIDVYGL